MRLGETGRRMDMLCETLPDMDKKLTLRGLAGSLVRDEIARQHLDQTRVADMAHMARSTLSKIVNGTSETISPVTLRSIEGALGMPRHLLTAVIDGDADRIEGMDFADTDLKRHVLASLRDLLGNPTQARAGKSRTRRGA